METDTKAKTQTVNAKLLKKACPMQNSANDANAATTR